MLNLSLCIQMMMMMMTKTHKQTAMGEMSEIRKL